MSSVADNDQPYAAQAEAGKGNITRTDNANLMVNQNGNCNAFTSPNADRYAGELDEGSAVKNMSYASPIVEQLRSVE